MKHLRQTLAVLTASLMLACAAFAANTFSNEGTGVSAEFEAAKAGTAVVGCFDANGRLIGAKTLSVTAGGNEAFVTVTGAAKTVKVFFFDSLTSLKVADDAVALAEVSETFIPVGPLFVD